MSPVAYCKHKAEKTSASTDHTDCLSQPALFLFETNKYIPGLSILLEKVFGPHPWCLQKFPKEALSRQLSAPERVSDRWVRYKWDVPNLQATYYFLCVFCLEVTVRKNEDKNKMWPRLATLNLKGLPDQTCTWSRYR